MAEGTEYVRATWKQDDYSLSWVQSQSTIRHKNIDVASKCNLASQWYACAGSTEKLI